MRLSNIVGWFAYWIPATVHRWLEYDHKRACNRSRICKTSFKPICEENDTECEYIDLTQQADNDMLFKKFYVCGKRRMI